jgi:tetratricopeptide (TPR) repeat protein
MNELLKWLHENQLEKYADILQQNDITSVDLLIELSEDDLKELNFSLGDRKRFTIAVKNISINSIDLSPDDVALINSLPYVIAYPLKRTLIEKHPWTRINLLKDTFLNYLKYIGLITASEFFNSPLKDKKMVALFQQALAEPSFGSWNQYIRETLSYLKENKHSFFCSDLLSYYDLIESGKKRKLFKGEIEIMDSNGDIQIKKQEATAIGMLINFRNRYLGHGLTLDEIDAVNHWEMYFPIFRELLVQLKFSEGYPMFKCEHGETYLLKSAEISLVEKGNQIAARVWIENPEGNSMDILPFFVVPGEVSIGKEDKEQLLTYESYTGKTIKFFSPEGTEKQTSGKILEKLNLLLRDKQKEQPYTPDFFNKELFLTRVVDENKLMLNTLVAEKKYIPGVYVHREEIEIKLREWIGARNNIFFIAAEAGSGKTNLLVEMQRQYSESSLVSLLIRAARMEKRSLHEQITYLLNIQEDENLINYPDIAGFQDAPTIILIDGINEATNAEELWKEILEISKVFTPGSFKFIVTCRANTNADIQRWKLVDEEVELLYGEGKEGENGLSAYVHWLTPLNMDEMKQAWEMYILKDKNKFKPQFSFDDLAALDRALYNQISNPLVLRLFLETYHGKVLSNKVGKHINIWEDWLNTFSKDELTFLNLLAAEVWNKGENELLLDDLLQNREVKSFLTSDLIKAPYPRLKNIGWISRYNKDLSTYLAHTVEGALYYLLGKQLILKEPKLRLTDILNLLKEGNKLKCTAVEEYLCQKALAEDLSFITELIDLGEDFNEVCINPMIIYLKTFGSQKMINGLLKTSTKNDWIALNKIVNRLSDLHLNILENEILQIIIEIKSFEFEESTVLFFKALKSLDHKRATKYFSEIDLNNDIFKTHKFCKLLGSHYEFIGEYKKALSIYEECLKITQNSNEPEINTLLKDFTALAIMNNKLGLFEESMFLLEKILNLQLDMNSRDYLAISSIYYYFGFVWNNIGNYNKSLEFYNKAIDIRRQLFGNNHISVSRIFNNLAVVYDKMGEIHTAVQFIEKSMHIRESLFKPNDINHALSYTNLGDGYSKIGRYEEARYYLEKGLNIQLNHFGSSHPKVAISLYYLGNLQLRLGKLIESTKFYEDALKISELKLGEKHLSTCLIYYRLGQIYKHQGNLELAFNFFFKSHVTMKNGYGFEADMKDDLDDLLKSLAKKIGKEYKI